MMNLAIVGRRKENTTHPCRHPGDSLIKMLFFCCPGSESCSHTREETSRATQKIIGEWAFPFPIHPGRMLGTLGEQQLPREPQTREKGKQQHFLGLFFFLFSCSKNSLGAKLPKIHFASPQQ